MVKLLIDGYNLLHAWKDSPGPEINDLEAQRTELLENLRHYQSQRQSEITVIFDGAGPLSHLHDVDFVGAIKVVFTAKGQSADAWIHEACRREPERFAVVSNDREVRASALDFKCTPLYCEEFLQKLLPVVEPANLNPYLEDKEDDGPLYPKVTTKKRGSGRRTSKRDRKKKSILRKI